jgi:hypothetical protein
VALIGILLVIVGAVITWRLVRGFLRRVGRLRSDLQNP